jgi:benzylsuccinate CoA-transferase BbsF subunit
MGAEVIRVETPMSPDIIRLLTGTDGVPGFNRSGIFNGINFSKQSICVNLGNPAGSEIARRLVRISDIATENFTVGNMQKFGLDYEKLRLIKPDLIMLSGTPLGQTGPLARSVGWGPTTQAFAGISHLTGYPGEFPCGIGGTWPDFPVGVAMVFVLLAALHHRDRTGEGQYIDVSMAEMVTSMLPEAFMDFFMNGREAGPIGNRDECMAPHGVFPTAGDDQWIAIAISTDAEFGIFCDLVKAPQLAADPKYSKLSMRLLNVADLEAEISELTINFDRDDLVTRLRARNLVAGPIYRVDEVVNDPAFASSGMAVKLAHKETGERLVTGLPLRFSEIEPDYRPAPLIGEHTDSVLTELLGYSSEEVAQFRSAGVIY